MYIYMLRGCISAVWEEEEEEEVVVVVELSFRFSCMV
jgi:hypothetical protein